MKSQNEIDCRFEMPLFTQEVPIIKSPKELDVCVCNVHRACELNELWHSRFPKIHWSNVVRNTHYICFNAIKEECSFACAIWSSPVAANRMKDPKSILELRRMAISGDAPKNTATYMISRMIHHIKNNMPDVNRLISYQDEDVHRGIIYKASNWTAVTSNKGQSWTTDSRKRNKEQSMARKTRWEYAINRKNK